MKDRAIELLSALGDMKEERSGQPPSLALVSNLNSEISPNEYYDIIEALEISTFFKPFSERVTLSCEVGVEKPCEIFRTAIDKIHKDLPYQNVIFIANEPKHIYRTSKLGMKTIRVRLEGETGKGIDNLREMVKIKMGLQHTHSQFI